MLLAAHGLHRASLVSNSCRKKIRMTALLKKGSLTFVSVGCGSVAILSEFPQVLGSCFFSPAFLQRGLFAFRRQSFLQFILP
jgi:hypothetical protein